jgi:L-amino acid N-acyltransferase YncA
MISAIQISVLTKEVCERHAKRLQEIDEPHVLSGNLELWTYDHFLSDLDDKWELSTIATISEEVIGYRVASGAGKISGYCHSHRTSIAMDKRRMGVGSLLLWKSVDRARELGYCGMTGMRNPNNLASQRFLCKMGWQRAPSFLNGNELWFLEFDY